MTAAARHLARTEWLDPGRTITPRPDPWELVSRAIENSPGCSGVEIRRVTGLSHTDLRAALDGLLAGAWAELDTAGPGRTARQSYRSIAPYRHGDGHTE